MKPGKWIPKIVMVAFFVGALLYFVGYAVRTFRSEVTTTVIHTSTVEDSVEGTGLVIRREEPVEGTGELMEVLPAEGETVAKGETLALIYESGEALEQQEETAGRQYFHRPECGNRRQRGHPPGRRNRTEDHPHPLSGSCTVGRLG